MNVSDELVALIARLRAGDQNAAVQLVRLYEHEIRLEVRTLMRRRHSTLRRAFDSEDILQAVLCSFLIRVAAGQFELDQPERLLPLLMKMARYKFEGQVKRLFRKGRDIRRVIPLELQHDKAVSSSCDPADEVAIEELLQEFRKQFSHEMLQIANFRRDGMEWKAIADRLGGTPESRRRQFGRAVNGIIQEMGLDELPPL